MEKKSVKNDNILIIFGRHSSDMKSLYHAFALAERINAKVFVLFFKEENFTQEQVTPLEKACLEMVHSACEEGISVSFHIASGRFEEELFNIIKMEHINLVVISNGDTEMELIIKEFKLGIPIQIIKVKGKNNINPI
jgi:hypothetical protein